MNIFTLPRTPGATETTEWTACCHSKEPFIAISHDRFTGDYRRERKRPFRVTVFGRRERGFSLSRGADHWFATLTQAQAFAAKLGNA